MILGKVLENIFYRGLESIGKFYSVYRGYVVDNEDPDNLNKLSLKIPGVTKRYTHPTWAWPRNNFAGNDYGLQILPQKGDMVMVEFDHGDPTFPIWSHAHYAENQKPEEFSSPQIYGFKSPKGQIIIIDDDQEIIKINQGENHGLVKVEELTEKLNNLEQKVNDFLIHYRTHMLIDPISGVCGPLQPAPSAPIDLIKTKQSEIENDKVLH